MSEQFKGTQNIIKNTDDGNDIGKSLEEKINAQKGIEEAKKIRSGDIVKDLASEYFPNVPELQSLFREKIIYGKTEDDGRLAEAMKGNPAIENINSIRVFESKEFELDKDKEVILSTNELNGCMVSLIISENPAEKRRKIHFAHYPPISEGGLPISSIHLQKMKEFLGKINKEDIKNIFLYANNKRLVDPRKLETVTREALGGVENPIKIETYNNDPEKDDNGTLIIKIPAENKEGVEAKKDQPTFYSWEKNGKID